MFLLIAWVLLGVPPQLLAVAEVHETCALDPDAAEASALLQGRTSTLRLSGEVALAEGEPGPPHHPAGVGRRGDQVLSTAQVKGAAANGTKQLATDKLQAKAMITEDGEHEATPKLPVASWFQLDTARVRVWSWLQRLREEVLRHAGSSTMTSIEGCLLLVGLILVAIIVRCAAVQLYMADEREEGTVPGGRVVGPKGSGLRGYRAERDSRLASSTVLEPVVIEPTASAAPAPSSAPTSFAALSAAETPAGTASIVSRFSPQSAVPLCDDLVVPKDHECALILPATALGRWDIGKSGSFDVTDTKGAPLVGFSVTAPSPQAAREAGTPAPRIIMTSTQGTVLAYCCARPGAVGPFFVYRQSRELFATCDRSRIPSSDTNVAHRYALVEQSTGGSLFFDLPRLSPDRGGHLTITDDRGSLQAAVGPWDGPVRKTSLSRGEEEATGSLLVRIGPQGDTGALLSGLLCSMQLLRLERPSAAEEIVQALTARGPARQPSMSAFSGGVLG